MRPESEALLRDMLDAARTIADYTRGRTEPDYVRERSLRDAGQWNFCVIGEALAKLSALDPSTAGTISESRRIIAFRNQLIHGYGVINHSVTWSIIRDKLPILTRELQALLHE